MGLIVNAWRAGLSRPLLGHCASLMSEEVDSIKRPERLFSGITSSLASFLAYEVDLDCFPHLGTT